MAPSGPAEEARGAITFLETLGSCCTGSSVDEVTLGGLYAAGHWRPCESDIF